MYSRTFYKCGGQVAKNKFFLLSLPVFLLVSAWNLSAEEYYKNDFENSQDDISHWESTVSNKGHIVKFKGIIAEAQGGKAYSGDKSFKMDIMLTDSKANEIHYDYWKSGAELKIPLNKPVFLSGFIYFPEFDEMKDIDVRIGFRIRGTLNSVGKFCEGNSPVKTMKKTKEGWWFQQVDLHKQLVTDGPWAEDTVLLGWYISIKSKKKFNGQRIIFYIDDVEVSSKKKEIPGLSGNAARPEITKGNPYTVKYMSAFRDRVFPVKNLIDNSSFELGTKSWGLTCSGRERCWEIDDTQAYHGKKSLKLYTSAAEEANSFTVNSLPVPIKEGKDYVFSVYMKGSQENESVCVNGISFSLAKRWRRYEVPLKNLRGNIKAGCYSVRIKYSGNSAIWLDAAQFENANKATEYSIPKSLEIGLNTTRKINVYSSGDTTTVLLSLRNGLSETSNPRICFQIKDFEGKIITDKKKSFSLEPDETVDCPLTFKLSEGFYKVTANVISENTSVKSARCSFSVINKVSDDKASVYSSGGFHFNSSSDFALKTDEMLGHKYIMLYHLLMLSDAPENWRNKNFQWKLADRKLELLKARNLTPVVALCGLPSWEKIEVKSAGSPRDPAKLSEKILNEWRDYTHAVVKKYKDRVKYWDIWPEFVRFPIDVDAGMYVKFLKVAYETIKALDPEAVVIGIGAENSGPARSMDYQKFLSKNEAVFKLGGLKYMDIVGIHPYGPFYSPEELDYSGALKKLKSIIRKYNNNREKPVWVTEVGWRGIDTLYYDLKYGEGNRYANFIAELGQAENLVRMNIISMAHGIKKFFPFTNYAGSYTNIYAYSLFDNDFISPKPGFSAWNNMADILFQASFVSRVKLPDGISCYEFKKGNEFIYVLWHCDKTAKIKIAFDINAAELKVINLTGSTVSMSSGKPVSLELNGSPVYVIGKTGELKKAIRNCRVKKGNGNIISKASFDGRKLHLKIRNLSSHQLDGRISMFLPSGWRIKASSIDFNLASRETRGYQNYIQVDAYNPLKDVVGIKIAAKTEVCNHQIKPVMCPYVETGSNGQVKTWGKITPLCLGKSEIIGKNWKNRDDLSAVIRTFWDEKALYFKIDVTDDKHVQPYNGSKIWAGDAVQIAFDTANDALPGQGYNHNDYELGFALTAKGPYSYIWHGKQSVAQAVSGIKTDCRRNGNTTCYRVALPWSFLKVVPVCGESIRFNVTVMDNDGSGIQHFLQITDGLAGSMGKQPCMYRDLIFFKGKTSFDFNCFSTQFLQSETKV